MPSPGITDSHRTFAGSVSQAAISRTKIPYPNQHISRYYYEAQTKAEIFAYGKTFRKAGRESGCHLHDLFTMISGLRSSLFLASFISSVIQSSPYHLKEILPSINNLTPLPTAQKLSQLSQLQNPSTKWRQSSTSLAS
jgi:hypothetical protein